MPFPLRTFTTSTSVALSFSCICRLRMSIWFMRISSFGGGCCSVSLKSSLESFAGVTLTDARVDQNVVTVNAAAAVQTPLITRDGQAVGISQAELLWMRDDEVMDS